MNRIIMWVFFVALSVYGFLTPAQAQTDKDILSELAAENESAINALVLYPEQTRLSILEATVYPEALIKMESIQTQTSTSFRELLGGYPQSTQEMIWDLTRYPNLISQLVAVGNGSESGLKKMLKDYPEVIHDRAKDAVKYNYQDLVKINELNQSAEAAFLSLLKGYPQKTQAALQELIALPEVLSILTENIRLTVLIGDLYEKEPAWVIHQADSLSLVIARQNAQELEDWKASLENNPEAMEELQASAEIFSEEDGYDDAYYEYEYDDLYYDEDDEVTVVHRYYYDYHYPYWFGYPHWYYYPRWRIYPYWYYWGFYYGPSGNYLVIGLPSFYFTHWYFYHPSHHYHYSNLSAHFVNHYYGHRSVGSSITTGVNDWQSRNREVINDDWLQNDGKLTSRFQEFGKFEAERSKYNQSHPDKMKSQADYAERYSSRYPSLSKSAERQKSGNVSPATPRPNRGDKVSPKPQPPKTEPKSRTSPQVRPPKTTVPKVKKGTDYHRNTWERAKPSPAPKMKQPAPRTRTPKVQKPRKTSPKTRKGTSRNNN